MLKKCEVYSGRERWRGRGRFWARRIIVLLLKRGCIKGGRGRFWEGCTDTFVERGDIFWGESVDSRRVAYSCRKAGNIMRGGVDSGSVAYIFVEKKGLF